MEKGKKSGSHSMLRRSQSKATNPLKAPKKVKKIQNKIKEKVTIKSAPSNVTSSIARTEESIPSPSEVEMFFPEKPGPSHEEGSHQLQNRAVQLKSESSTTNLFPSSPPRSLGRDLIPYQVRRPVSPPQFLYSRPQPHQRQSPPQTHPQLQFRSQTQPQTLPQIQFQSQPQPQPQYQFLSQAQPQPHYSTGARHNQDFSIYNQMPRSENRLEPPRLILPNINHLYDPEPAISSTFRPNAAPQQVPFDMTPPPALPPLMTPFSGIRITERLMSFSISRPIHEPQSTSQAGMGPSENTSQFAGPSGILDSEDRPFGRIGSRPLPISTPDYGFRLHFERSTFYGRMPSSDEE